MASTGPAEGAMKEPAAVAVAPTPPTTLSAAAAQVASADAGAAASRRPRLCRQCGQVKKGHRCTKPLAGGAGATSAAPAASTQAPGAAWPALPAGAWLPFMQMLPGIPQPAGQAGGPRLPEQAAADPGLGGAGAAAGAPPAPPSPAAAAGMFKPFAPPPPKRPAEGDGPALAKRAKVQGEKSARAPYKCRLCNQPAKGHVCPNKDLPAPPKAARARPKPPPCPHGGPGGIYARLRKCVECRAEVCEHNRRKLMCRFCTPENTAICIHNRDKGICKDCGVATRRCIHDRVKSVCKVPGMPFPASAPPARARVRAYRATSAWPRLWRARRGCRLRLSLVRVAPAPGADPARCPQECGKGSICVHKRQKAYCKDCGGSQICPHNKVRKTCKECGGSQVPPLPRPRSPVCRPSTLGRCLVRAHGCGARLTRWVRLQICQHGKRRRECRACGGNYFCKHGKCRYKCAECKHIKLPKGRSVRRALLSRARRFAALPAPVRQDIAALRWGADCRSGRRAPGSGTVNKAPPAQIDVQASLAGHGDMLPRKVFFSVLESVQDQHKAQVAFLKQQSKYECERLNKLALRHEQEVRRLKKELAALKPGSAALDSLGVDSAAGADGMGVDEVGGGAHGEDAATSSQPPPPPQVDTDVAQGEGEGAASADRGAAAPLPR